MLQKRYTSKQVGLALLLSEDLCLNRVVPSKLLCDRRESSLCCIATSLACILKRACSRKLILSFSMEGNGSFAGDGVSKMSEEEFGAGKYMESVKSVLGLWNMPIVD